MRQRFPAGDESLPGSYLTQIKTMVETRLVRIKAQLFLLAAELLPAEKLKRLHAYCLSLRGVWRMAGGEAAAA